MVLTRHTYMFDFEVSSTAIDTMGQFQLKRTAGDSLRSHPPLVLSGPK